MNKFFCIFFVVSLTLFAIRVSATHIIGGEIGYTHTSGYTYEIVLTLYGDCAGTAFPSLINSIPRVEIYKDAVPNSFIDLGISGPPVEVTPVCPSEVNNTTCVSVNGTIPGVMRFIFKGTVVLDGPAVKWSFLFNSQLGPNAGAGRTNAITNIDQQSRMALEATLNNMNGPNNSSVFTTIPTPFFCINLPQEYNQGAADPDNDLLSFAFTPGLNVDNSGSLVGSVSYIAPYTYLNPLATVPGSFNFNTSSGQMSFTPNQLQTSLVVNLVTEKRGGVVVGTCMREMNLVVLNNCNNQPPFASIPSSSIGSFDANRTITLCNSILNPQFVINASDPDGQDITVTVSGLPSVASYSISGNGSSFPMITINWNIGQPTVPGVYNFYVNCQDDGCPLTSQQTFAYTVILEQPISDLQFIVSNETCIPGSDGSILVSSSSTNGAVTYSLNGGVFQIPGLFSSLVAGNYTISVKDLKGCTLSSDTAIVSTPLPVLNYVLVPESCKPGQDGSITISASSQNGGISGYSLNGGPFTASNSFSNLSAGIYTIAAKDIVGCIGSLIMTLGGALIPVITNTVAKDITCFGKSNGMIDLTVSPAGLLYNYQLEPGSKVNTTGKFDSLQQGSYMIVVVTAQECSDTSYANINEPDELIITDIDIQLATCDKDNGKIALTTNGTGEIFYTLRPATFINTEGFFTDVAPGYYTISVRDANFCSVDSLIYVGAYPNLFTSSMTHEDLRCNGWGTEGSAEVFPSNGVEPYTYLWNTDPPLSEKKISNLYYGWYFVNITDATGCETSDTVYINPGSCCENIYIPNAFTPNGDGNNDEWKLVTSTGLSIDQFAVFNRWGEKIWYSTDQRTSWDGRRNGTLVETGTYFYLLRYKCLTDGKNYIKKGDVMVLK